MIEDSNLVIKRYVVCWKFVVKMAGAAAKGTLVTYFLPLLLSDNFLPNTVHGRNRLSVRLLGMLSPDTPPFHIKEVTLGGKKNSTAV